MSQTQVRSELILNLNQMLMNTSLCWVKKGANIIYVQKMDQEIG